jgi:hypothetical protein
MMPTVSPVDAADCEDCAWAAGVGESRLEEPRSDSKLETWTHPQALTPAATSAVAPKIQGQALDPEA